MFISNELKSAIEAAQKKHPHIIFDKHLVRLFIGKLNELKENYTFGEAMRYSLNHVGIWDKNTRKAYSSMAGTYFGRRSRRKASQKKQSLDKHQNMVSKNGQYEFDI